MGGGGMGGGGQPANPFKEGERAGAHLKSLQQGPLGK